MNIPKITQMAMNAAQSGGGGKREGTAIPYGESVDKIYWNTSLTREETDAILAQLTYIETPFFVDPINAIYANTADGDTGYFILALKEMKGGELRYRVIFITRVSTKNIIAQYDTAQSEAYPNGWGYPIENGQNYIASGIHLYNPSEQALTDFNGIPVGAENEKIKNVLSITPF